MSNYSIFVNRIKCKHCGDVLTSETRNDFKMCSCGKVGIDGGEDYLRRLGYPENYDEMSIMELED